MNNCVYEYSLWGSVWAREPVHVSLNVGTKNVKKEGKKQEESKV